VGGKNVVRAKTNVDVRDCSELEREWDSCKAVKGLPVI
jgi:hypothetical protein